MGLAIIITSGSGGSGKTTFAVNLAASFASAGAKTLVTDMQSDLRSGDIYMGAENKVLFDFGDVASGLCKLEKAIVKSPCSDNLFLFSSVQNKSVNMLGEKAMRILMQTLKQMFDIVIIDAGACIGEKLRLLSLCADVSLLVVTPDYVSVRNGDAIDKNLASYGLKKRFYAVNRIKTETIEREELPSAAYLSDVFRIPLAGVVMEDEAVNIANNSGRPAALDENSYISKVFAEMAARLIN